MTRVAVVGASGRLGRLVLGALLRHDGVTLAAALTRSGSSALGVDAGVLAGEPACGVTLSALGEGFGDAAVVIDVSLPEATPAVCAALDGRALVTGVTGGGADAAASLQAAATASAVLRAANFSTGVHVLADVVATAARALPDHDVEIVEAHHRHKVDAPSGTALLLARAAATARGWSEEAHRMVGRAGAVGPRGDEIGIHAVRGGDVVGEHTVWLAGAGERLLLGHVASSRATFAHGAVRAARWLDGRAPGTYTMRHVLGLDPHA